MEKRTQLVSGNSATIDSPLPLLGITVINPTDATCNITDDGGSLYTAPPRTIVSYSLPPTLKVKASLGAVSNGKICTVIVTDQPTVNTIGQLATLTPSWKFQSLFVLGQDSIGFGSTTPQNEPLAQDLMIVLNSRLSIAPSGGINIQLNNDATSHNYGGFRYQSDPAQMTLFPHTVNGGLIYAGETNGPNDTDGAWTPTEITIFDYQDAARNKTVKIESGTFNDQAHIAGTPTFFQTHVNGRYDSLNPVTQFGFTATLGGTFRAGTFFVQYTRGQSS